MIHRGRVVRVSAAGVFVESDSIAPGYEIGPLEAPIGTLNSGDRVLLGSVDGIDDDLVLLPHKGALLTLDNLSDVVITAPAANNVLQYNGTNWVNKATLDLNATPGSTDLLTVRVTADTNPRLVINADGTVEWGTGSATPDVNLYRGGANILQTDDEIWVNAPTSGFGADRGAFLSQLVGDNNPRLNIQVSGKLEWGPGNAARDTNLYRNAANELKTDDAFVAAGAITGLGNVTAIGDLYAFGQVGAGGGGFSLIPFGESNPTWRVDGAGVMSFAADGGGSAADVNLYRSAANILKTDDDFHLVDTKQVNVGGSASGAAFSVTRTLTNDDGYSSRSSGASDNNDRFLIEIDGRHHWGPGNAATDTNLFRDAASTLKTDDNLIVALKLTVQGTGIDANAGHEPKTGSNATDDLAFTQTGYSTNQSCGCTFVAPPTGRVIAMWHVRMESNTAAVFVLASINIRQGGTIGSGTLVFTANDSDAITSAAQARIAAGDWVIQTGLTAGNTYNAEIVYKVSGAGNGDMFDQKIVVLPWVG